MGNEDDPRKKGLDTPPSKWLIIARIGQTLAHINLVRENAAAWKGTQAAVKPEVVRKILKRDGLLIKGFIDMAQTHGIPLKSIIYRHPTGVHIRKRRK